jgi:hypothetical protein
MIRKETAAQRGRPQMTIWRMRIPCRIPKATNTHTHTHTHTHTLRLCNTHCFSTATMVMRTRQCYVIYKTSALFIFLSLRQTNNRFENVHIFCICPSSTLHQNIILW